MWRVGVHSHLHHTVRDCRTCHPTVSILYHPQEYKQSFRENMFKSNSWRKRWTEDIPGNTLPPFAVPMKRFTRFAGFEMRELGEPPFVPCAKATAQTHRTKRGRLIIVGTHDFTKTSNRKPQLQVGRHLKQKLASFIPSRDYRNAGRWHNIRRA